MPGEKFSLIFCPLHPNSTHDFSACQHCQKTDQKWKDQSSAHPLHSMQTSFLHRHKMKPSMPHFRRFRQLNLFSHHRNISNDRKPAFHFSSGYQIGNQKMPKPWQRCRNGKHKRLTGNGVVSGMLQTKSPQDNPHLNLFRSSLGSILSCRKIQIFSFR